MKGLTRNDCLMDDTSHVESVHKTNESSVDQVQDLSSCQISLTEDTVIGRFFVFELECLTVPSNPTPFDEDGLFAVYLVPIDCGASKAESSRNNKDGKCFVVVDLSWLDE